MKTCALLFVSLGLFLSTVQPAFAQHPPCPEKDKKTEQTKITPNDTPKTQQLMDGQNGQIVTVNRAAQEIRFNQKVEELDARFHTPPHLQAAPARSAESGCAAGRPAGAPVQ